MEAGLKSGVLLCVSGVTGSGKTSILAKAVAHVGVTHSHANLVVRFLGTSQESKTKSRLLRSVCSQLRRLYPSPKLDSTRIDEMNSGELIALFHSLLERSSENEPLIVVFDSLDQLQGTETLDWLPRRAVPNVIFVVSLIPTIDTLQSYIEKSFGSPLLVPLLDPRNIISVLEFWLKADCLCLSSQHKKGIVAIVRRAPEPTYLLLRILYNEARLWKSFAPVPVTWKSIKDVPSAIHSFFDRIHDEHGTFLSTVALSALTFSRHGLTQNDIEDILSVDDQVLQESFQWWIPPVARIPPLQVTRLLFALKDNLGSNNRWFHRQFLETAKERYRAQEIKTHMLLSKWCRTASTSLNAFGSRMYHLAKCNQQHEIPSVMLDFQWLFQALSYGVSAVDLVSDFQQFSNKESEGYDWAKTASLALIKSIPALRHDVKQLASQLVGRLSQDHPLYEQASTFRIQNGWLRPVTGASLAPAKDQVKHIFRGHDDKVQSVAVHGNFIASGSADKTIGLWNIDTAESVGSLQGHSNWVSSVAFSPCGTKLVSGSYDETLRLWDTRGACELKCVSDIHCAVWGVAFSPDGSSIVAALDNRWILIYDANLELQKRKMKKHIRPVVTVAFSPNSRWIVSGSRDSSLWIWDATSGDALRQLQGHLGEVTSVCYTHDGHRIVSGSVDNTAIVWDSHTGEQVLRLTAHIDTVHSVSVSSLWIVTASEDRTIKLWSINDETPKANFTLTGHSSGIHGAVVSEYGIVTGSADKTVRVWDMPTENQQLQQLQTHDKEVTCIAIGTDIIATGSEEGTIIIWDQSTGELRHRMNDHGERITCVAFWCDDLLVSGSGHSSESRVMLWDGSCGEEIWAVNMPGGGVSSVAWEPKGTRVLATPSDRSKTKDYSMYVLDARTGEILLTLQGNTGWVTEGCYSPNGEFIGSGGFDRTIRFWNPLNGNLVLENKIQIESSNSKIRSLAFSPDSELVAAGMGDDNLMVVIMGCKTGDILRVFQEKCSRSASTVSFSCDGICLLTSSDPFWDDYTVVVWNIETGEKDIGGCQVSGGVHFKLDGITVGFTADERGEVWRILENDKIVFIAASRPLEILDAIL